MIRVSYEVVDSQIWGIGKGEETKTQQKPRKGKSSPRKFFRPSLLVESRSWKMPSSPKAFYARTSFNSRRSAVLIIVYVFLGLSAVIGLYAMVKGRSNGCDGVKPLSVSVTWDKSSSGGGSGGAALDKGQKRHKVMGFVGIQTGFGSAGRRRSLRRTWFPSDHQGLKRYSLCFLFYFCVLVLHFCTMMRCIYSRTLRMYTLRNRFLLEYILRFLPLDNL